MKTLLWLPSIVADICMLLLPRWLFLLLYKPAGDRPREAEEQSRNVSRLATYKVKKFISQ